MTSGVRRVDLSHVLLSPTDRWGTFLAGVFDLDEDICERANRILRPMAARSVVHCLAGELDDPEAVLLASVDDRDRTVGHIELLGVRPDRRGRGPARDLVTCAERVLAACGVGTALWAGNPPCYAWPGIDLRYTAGLGAAESLGYAETRLAHDMTVDLADAARRGVFAGCRAVAGVPDRAVDGPGALGADRPLSEAGIVVLRGSALTGGPEEGPGRRRGATPRLDHLGVRRGLAGRGRRDAAQGPGRADRRGLRRPEPGGDPRVRRLRRPAATPLRPDGHRRRRPGHRHRVAPAPGMPGRPVRRRTGARRHRVGGPGNFYSKVVGARVSRVYRLSSKRIVSG